MDRFGRSVLHIVHLPHERHGRRPLSQNKIPFQVRHRQIQAQHSAQNRLRLAHVHMHLFTFASARLLGQNERLRLVQPDVHAVQQKLSHLRQFARFLHTLLHNARSLRVDHSHTQAGSEQKARREQVARENNEKRSRAQTPGPQKRVERAQTPPVQKQKRRLRQLDQVQEANRDRDHQRQAGFVRQVGRFRAEQPQTSH